MEERNLKTEAQAWEAACEGVKTYVGEANKRGSREAQACLRAQWVLAELWLEV